MRRVAQFADSRMPGPGIVPAVRTFLSRTPVSFPIGLAGLDGTTLGKSLGNASGALPFTVVLSAEGQVLHRKMGRLSAADLDSWSRPN